MSIVCGVGLAAKAQIAGVTTVYTFQTSHVVLFPLPPKNDYGTDTEHLVQLDHPHLAWQEVAHLAT